MEKYIVDVALASIFVIITLIYFFRGFAKTVLNTAAIVVAAVVTLKFSGMAADWILKNTRFLSDVDKGMANVIVAVVCFVLILSVLSWVVYMLNKIFKIPVLKQANRILGGILGAVNGAIIVLILSVCLQISAHMVYNARYLDTVNNSIIVQTLMPADTLSGSVSVK